MPNDAVVNLLASKFIRRTDVRAIQAIDGKWAPETSTGRVDGPRIPWDRNALNAHVDGQRSYGHYLLDLDSTCKLFAFDVDLKKTGELPVRSAPPGDDFGDLVPCDDLRAAWLDRSHPARAFMKYQFHHIAHFLCRGIYEQLGLPCAAAYSGGKGIHVYGFTGPIPAADAREGSRIVLDALKDFTQVRGENFWAHPAWPNLEIETFPKQDSLDGKDLGNLMRLPLGRNLKNPDDPTFFIDLTAPMDSLQPVDPVWALTTDNPWRKLGD